ncbi:MAG: response regulator, partial [Phaeodactylibacter sp.]|nr:response regulator [Phaeodactylibacter sp.]
MNLSIIHIVKEGIFFTCFLLFTAGLFAQSTAAMPAQQTGLPYIQNFRSADYGAAPQNYSITQSPQGLMYFGNEKGLLEYDGTTWRLIPLPNNMIAYAVSCGTDGKIYVGGEGDLGFMAPDDKGNLQFVSLKKKIPEKYRDFNPVWQAVAAGPYVYFATDKYFFRWRADGTEKEMAAWAAKNIYHTCHTLNGAFYVWEWGDGLKRLEGDSLRMVPGGEAFTQATIRIMAPFSASAGEKIFIGTVQRGLCTYDGNNVERLPVTPAVREFLHTKNLYNSVRLRDGNFALASSKGGIAIIDPAGNLIRLLDKSNGLQDDVTYFVFTDREGGLWVAFNNGISRIRIPSAFTFFSDELGLVGSARGVIHYQSQFYGYGTGGIFQYTAAGPEGYQPFFQELPSPAADNEVADMAIVNGKLIAAASSGLFSFHPDGAIEHQVVNYSGEFLLPSRFHPGLAYAGLGIEAGLVQVTAQGWELAATLRGIEGVIRSIAEATPRRLWITTSEQVLRVEITDPNFPPQPGSPNRPLSARIEAFGQADGLPEGACYAHALEERVLFATSAGIRAFDPVSNTFVPDQSLPYNDTSRMILSFSAQANGDIWLINQDKEKSELIQLRRSPNGTYVRRSQNFRHILLEGMSIFGIDSDPADRDIAWISTSEGLIKYDPGVEKADEPAFPALVRKVIINGDSALFGGSATNMPPPVLPYASNAIRFEYTALSYGRPEETRYQVWLKGFDRGWQEWTEETKKDYTNLPEGSYTFSVRARNIYGGLSEEGRFEFSILPPWHRTWWAFLAYALLLAGAIYGLLRWRVNQLQQRTLELESLVGERTRMVEQQNVRLQEQAEKLKELDQMKSRFFTNISHELRTPLTIIGGMAEQIEKAPGQWMEKGLKMIKRNNANLLLLVNQILDLRKLESGAMQLNLAHGDIIFYLRYILESFHSLAESKDIRLHFLTGRKEVMMDYDEEKILRIVSNLLSNAIKFTLRGGDVYMTVDTRQQTGGNEQAGMPADSLQLHSADYLILTVKDTGIGIPKEKLPYIFDRFYSPPQSPRRGEAAGGFSGRLTAGSSPIGGGWGGLGGTGAGGLSTGIGLALTNELIQLMKGDIEVKSEKGEGSTFTVQLPITAEGDVMDAIPPLRDEGPAKAQAVGTVESPTIASVTAPAGRAPIASRDTLLIIEDNPDVVLYLQSLLEEQYELLIARDGQEGIDKAIEEIPGLIISDVMMPRKDGFEVCETLKTDERTSHIPIILL